MKMKNKNKKTKAAESGDKAAAKGGGLMKIKNSINGGGAINGGDLVVGGGNALGGGLKTLF